MFFYICAVGFVLFDFFLCMDKFSYVFLDCYTHETETRLQKLEKAVCQPCEKNS
jgi:hypothetical protein